MTTRKNTGNFILGTLVGGLIGGVTALLMAPNSGEKTQELILETGESWRRRAEERMDEGRQYTESMLNQARNSIAVWLNRGSSLLQEKSQEIMAENGSHANESEKASTA